MRRKITEDEQQNPDVFDVGQWLDRASVNHPAPQTDYVPRHRADGPTVVGQAV